MHACIDGLSSFAFHILIIEFRDVAREGTLDSGNFKSRKFFLVKKWINLVLFEGKFSKFYAFGGFFQSDSQYFGEFLNALDSFPGPDLPPPPPEKLNTCLKLP